MISSPSFPNRLSDRLIQSHVSHLFFFPVVVQLFDYLTPALFHLVNNQPCIHTRILQFQLQLLNSAPQGWVKTEDIEFVFARLLEFFGSENWTNLLLRSHLKCLTVTICVMLVPQSIPFRDISPSFSSFGMTLFFHILRSLFIAMDIKCKSLSKIFSIQSLSNVVKEYK